MTNVQARKGLFVSIALAVALWLLREPLADLGSWAVRSLTSSAFDTSDGQRFVAAFFADRWALALAALASVYFAYRMTSTAKP